MQGTPMGRTRSLPMKGWERYAPVDQGGNSKIRHGQIGIILSGFFLINAGVQPMKLHGQVVQPESRTNEQSRIDTPDGTGGRLEPDELSGPLSDEVGGGIPNLAIGSVQIVAQGGVPMVAEAGKKFWVRVNFTYTNPVCTSYRIRRTVNDFTHDASPIDWGCGLSGTTSWWHSWGTWVMHKGGVYSVTVTLDAEDLIAESNEADNTVTLDFEASGTITAEWALVKAEEGLALLGDGTDVIVGTMDDAFDFHHPWVSGRDSLGRPRLVAADQNDFGPKGSPVNARHATALMGIVLARGNNDGDLTGLAPDARYITAEFINRANIPNHPVLHVLDAAGFLVEQGAEVINMSWSWWFGTSGQSESGETSVTNLMADYLSYGLNIVCVPAVNQLPTHVRPTSPGSSRNVITVGGLDDGLERAWIEQDHGPTLDGRSKPDLLGNDSVNAVTMHPAFREGFPAAEGWLGTSFSAPFVTGAVAQMLDYGKHHGQNTDHRVIKAVLMNSGVKMLDADGSPWSQSETTPLDDEQGTGVIDLVRVHSMYSAGEQEPGVTAVPGYDFGRVEGTDGDGQTGGTVVYRLGSPTAGGGTLDITLVWDRHTFWSDANGSGVIDAGDSFFHSSQDRQDNLDLVLHRDGNAIMASRSTVDNVEHIHLVNAAVGLYELYIVRRPVLSSGTGEEYALAWHSDNRWVYADSDEDGDIDIMDFASLQRCFADASLSCLQRFDFDESNDVGLSDFRMLHAVLTSPR